MVFFIINSTISSLRNPTIISSYNNKNKALDNIIQISTDFIKEK